MEERRLAHRYKLPLPVLIKRLPLDTLAGEMRVTTRDVSTTGVYFTSDERLAVGLKLDLSLTLPSEITQGSAVIIDAQARVMRVDEQPSGGEDRFGIAAAIDRFNVSRAAVDFALHKAQQVTGGKRPPAAASHG
jgi:c-di-GMP-binding flagellar brake protein YcgR